MLLVPNAYCRPGPRHFSWNPSVCFKTPDIFLLSDLQARAKPEPKRAQLLASPRAPCDAGAVDFNACNVRPRPVGGAVKPSCVHCGVLRFSGMRAVACLHRRRRRFTRIHSDCGN